MISLLVNQDTPLMLGFIKVNILCSGVSKDISGRAARERASTDKDLVTTLISLNFLKFLDSVYERRHTVCCV